MVTTPSAHFSSHKTTAYASLQKQKEQLNVASGYLELLDNMLTDPEITEIMINRFDRVYIEKNGVMQRSELTFSSAEEIYYLANSIIHLCGRAESVSENPIIDGILPDGNRVNVILPPVAVDGPTISIRKFPGNVITLDKMLEREMISPQVCAFLKASAQHRANIIVSGSTSSGKTTLLNALSVHIAPNERIVTIEDTAELQIQQDNVVRLECKSVASQNNDHISARDLVKTSLRMRPDRIIMGEIRGVEAFDMLQTMNTGHDGSMATMHANSPRDAFNRLENMINMANMNLASRSIKQQIAAAVDLIIQTQRDDTGQRRISHITEIVGLEGDMIVAQDLFVYTTDPRTKKSTYQWSNTSSRNPKIQSIIAEMKKG